jgi:hypothetical protein
MLRVVSYTLPTHLCFHDVFSCFMRTVPVDVSITFTLAIMLFWWAKTLIF